MVEATSSLPPIRYWVDVILTTVAVSAVRPNAKLLLTRKSMPVSPMLKRWWRTPLHPKGGRRSSIGAKQKHRNHAEQRGPANDPNGTARASAPGGQRPDLETQLRARVQMMIAWEARREAREERKLKAQGVKVSLMARAEITRLANAHLRAHAAELLAQAEASGGRILRCAL